MDPDATMIVGQPHGSAHSALSSGSADPDAQVPYVFGSEIARGGMGSILEAHDCKIGRTVAVKIMLSAAGADGDQKQRFINEAAVLGILEHPNIVPIHDLGRDADGHLFYTMKLVKGRTLQALLNDVRDEIPEVAKRYTLDRLLMVFRKVCDALAFAHSRGIIHRDLKPENVMVGEFGEVLVMDWGLAKQISESRNRMPERNPVDAAGASERELSGLRSPVSGFEATLAGTVMGTPQYMSPEQAMGQIDQLDERSDIFSLGGILYAILTLRPPVEGATLDEVLRKVTTAQITAPSALHAATTANGRTTKKGDVLDAKLIKPLPHTPGGRVPAALSSVAMKALQLDKAERYQQVAVLSADIEKFQAGFATGAEQASLAKQLVLLIKRNKGIFSTAAAAWLVITALAVWFVLHLRAGERETRRQAEIARQNEKKAVASEAVAVQEKEAVRKALAKTALALADAALREGDGAAMLAALGDVPVDLRDSTWTYLSASADTSMATFSKDSLSVEYVVAHPVLPGVFGIAERGGKISLMDVRTKVRRQEFQTPFQSSKGVGTVLAISPDGEQIAIGSKRERRIVIRGLSDGRTVSEWNSPETAKLEFSPDGKRLLQAHSGVLGLAVWTVATGQPAWMKTQEKQNAATVFSGIFTPDSKYLLTRGTGGLLLLSAADGSVIRSLGREGLTTLELAIRPDGQMAVVSSSFGRIVGVSLSDGRVLFEVLAQGESIKILGFVPDGGRFVSVSVQTDGRQAIQIWDSEKATLLQSLLGGSGSSSSAAVHPRTGELFVASEVSRVWDLVGSAARWTFPSLVPALQFCDSDDLVWAPIPSNPCVLQDLRGKNPTVLWKPPDGGYRVISASANGRISTITAPSSASPILMLSTSGSECQQVASFKRASAELAQIRLSTSGVRLAVVQQTKRGTQVYDAATGEQPAQLDRNGIVNVWDVGWMQDNRQLAGLVTASAPRGTAGSEEKIVVWDTTTGKVLRAATNRTVLGVLAISPDGTRIAEAGADKMLRIRDAATLAVLQEFRVHDGPITALAWHPTKPFVATGSADATVRLWNLATGRRLLELLGAIEAPTTVAFSPSGRRFGCAGPHSGTRIWELPPLDD